MDVTNETANMTMKIDYPCSNGNRHARIETRQLAFAKPLLTAALVATSLLAAAPVFADDAQGQNEGQPGSLIKWHDTYWRWYYGALTLPTDPNGNAEQDGVVLMPLPNAPGDGTPASLNVTLNAGQSFFLPFQAVAGTSYTDGTPPDPLVPFSVWKKIQFKLFLDGRQIISARDALQTYVQFYLDPPIVFDSPPIDSAIWIEGIGQMFPALRPGTHVLHLVESLTVPQFGFTVDYDNTWNITVLPDGLDNPPVFPPDSAPYGKTYGQWAAKHWQWTYSFPVKTNPLLMDGNVDLSFGQPQGPVWFLGGSFAPSPVPGGLLASADRTGTVPFGKALFFPIITAEASTAEGNGTNRTQLSASAVSQIAPVTGLACEIDGKSIKHLDFYQFESPLFTWGPLPTDNLFGDPVNFPAGLTSPSVADGYYLMLEPLPPGPHTLHFSGGVPGFALDITYHLNVRRFVGDFGDHD